MQARRFRSVARDRRTELALGVAEVGLLDGRLVGLADEEAPEVRRRPGVDVGPDRGQGHGGAVPAEVPLDARHADGGDLGGGAGPRVVGPRCQVLLAERVELAVVPGERGGDGARLRLEAPRGRRPGPGWNRSGDEDRHHGADDRPPRPSRHAGPGRSGNEPQPPPRADGTSGVVGHTATLAKDRLAASSRRAAASPPGGTGPPGRL